MSNIHEKRWQALRFAVDCVDMTISSGDDDDMFGSKDLITQHRKTLLDMQEDALMQVRASKNLDDESLDDGIKKRDFIQTYGSMDCQIRLYHLLADSMELIIQISQGTALFPGIKQEELKHKLAGLIKETEEFSGHKFQ